MEEKFGLTLNNYNKGGIEFASVDKKLFFLSRAGFTESTEKFARDCGIELLEI